MNNYADDSTNKKSKLSWEVILVLISLVLLLVSSLGVLFH